MPKNKVVKKSPKEIAYICHECGKQEKIKRGIKPEKSLGACTMHKGACDICGKVTTLAHIRDYIGYRDSAEWD